jgi:hypothetical protein
MPSAAAPAAKYQSIGKPTRKITTLPTAKMRPPIPAPTGILSILMPVWRPSDFIRIRNYALTIDPIFSPVMTRRIFPCSFRLKIMIGRLLSLQRLMAVESITFNPCFKTSI